jgi:hypothetical protein
MRIHSMPISKIKRAIAALEKYSICSVVYTPVVGAYPLQDTSPSKRKLA